MHSYTNSPVYFWLILVALTIMVSFCDRKYCMLKDISKAKPQPYSWSRVQLALWTVIVLASFIASIIKYRAAPDLNSSVLILLGISSATIAMARVIDVSDINNPAVALRNQDLKAQNFFLDILSDQNGVSIYRFQTVIFNIVFAVWFITHVVNNLVIDDAHVRDICTNFGGIQLTLCDTRPVDYIMPLFEQNNLILLGLSSATYAALKTTENKLPASTTSNNAGASEAEPNSASQETPVG